MRLLIFSLALAACTAAVAAEPDTIAVERQADTIAAQVHAKADTTAAQSDTAPPRYRRYLERVERYRRGWEILIPTRPIAQYAGNMGAFSIGSGWACGRHWRFETNLLFGYLPRSHTSSSKLTMTLKQTFIPWHLHLGKHWRAEPLTFGIYLNTVFGTEFWSKQPKRYPDKYYDMLSTKVRANVFAGQAFGVHVPRKHRRYVREMMLFYEVSACDLYIRSYIQDHNVGFWNILCLSVGLKMQVM